MHYVYIPECSEVNTFQCMNDSVCVNELQLCDGVADCPSGTDESIGCGTGKILYCYNTYVHT